MMCITKVLSTHNLCPCMAQIKSQWNIQSCKPSNVVQGMSGILYLLVFGNIIITSAIGEHILKDFRSCMQMKK